MERDEKQRRSVDSAAQEWRREVSTCNGVVTRSNDKQRLGEEEGMRAIEKLRELAADINSAEIIDHLDAIDKFVFRAEWLDSWHEAFDAACNEIEAEISERYMELPVDADGVTIRVGDKLKYDYGDIQGAHTVVALIYDGTRRMESDGGLWDFEFDDDKRGEDSREVICMKDFYECNRHITERTIEDVLRDCAWALGGKPEEAYLDDDWKNVCKYADELREMMGGNA